MANDIFALVREHDAWIRKFDLVIRPAFTPSGTVRTEILEGQLPTHDHSASGEGGGTVRPEHLRLRPGPALTVASGVITLTRGLHAVDTEGAAASDDVTRINGLGAGEVAIIYPVSGARTLVLKHGSDNIFAVGANADISLDDAHDFAWLFSPDGTNVWALFDTQGAGGSHNHTSGDGSGVLTNDEHDGYSQYAEIASPGTPAAGNVLLYAKSDGKFYRKDDTGTETELGAGGGGSALTVKEEDGAPSDAAVVEIQVPNGTLTVDSSGVVSLGYEVAGAVSTHAAAGDPHTGYVLESLFDQKGDLIAASADNTPAKLTAGSNGTVPTADSGASAGLSYQSICGAGTYAARPAAATNLTGHFYLATDRANTMYRCDGSTWIVVNPRTVRLEWYLDGRQRADASNAQGPVRYLPSLDGMTDESVALWKPVRTKLHCRTAPAGAALIVQLEFGTTAAPATDLFASGDRPQIAAAGNEGSSTTFADSAIENGTAFEPVIDQVGSTAGSEGEDLSIVAEFVQIDA